MGQGDDTIDEGVRCGSVLPVAREQFRQAMGGMGGEAREHIAQVGEGSDLMAVTTGDQTEEYGDGVAAAIRAAEEPVLPADRYQPLPTAERRIP